jgi:hypothetical protein
MPLAFESISHGTIAFGFFNIESDMLLLERYFFFASDFCARIVELAESDPPGGIPWTVHAIDGAERIGDLMGAIHGVRHTGFIGEVYRRFPFPQDPDGFKQQPDGWRTRKVMETIIARYARAADIRIGRTAETGAIAIGDYRFERAGFQQLLDYVWRGGYPRWDKERRPDYVSRMAAAVQASAAGMFSGTRFSA